MAIYIIKECSNIRFGFFPPYQRLNYINDKNWEAFFADFNRYEAKYNLSNSAR